MKAGYWTLALVLSAVGALGLTLLIAALSLWFVDGDWGRRMLTLSTLAVSAVVLLPCFAAAPSAKVTLERFRQVIVAEFVAFAVLGLLIAAGVVHSLF